MANQVVESVVQYEGKSARDLFFAPVIGLKTFNEQGIRIFEDIQSKLWLYYSGKLDKVTKLRTGCGWVATGNGVNIVRKDINVKDMQIQLEQCADEFNQTLWETAKKKGVEINDLTDTEIEAVLVQIVSDALSRDLARQIWFNDTSLVGNDDYNAYDGLFKHIAAGVAGSTVANVPISAMATGADAYNAINAVYNNQSLEMKGVLPAEKKILVSRNIYDLYETFLSTATGIEASYTALVNGVPTVAFKGVPVIPMDVWDAYFAADFSSDFGNGRIVMLVNERSLVVGMDATSDTTVVASWYDLKEDKQYFRSRYKAGTELHYHEYLSVAGFGANS